MYDGPKIVSSYDAAFSAVIKNVRHICGYGVVILTSFRTSNDHNKVVQKWSISPTVQPHYNHEKSFTVVRVSLPIVNK
ncbi:hypothetical protein QTP88_019149 [Uroleucon formosanum]